jgi:prepilin-type processing-associated H-X9-DG protein
VRAGLPLLGMTEAVPSVLVEEHWEAFDREGFLDLGPIILPAEGDWLRRRGEGLVGSDLVDLVSEEAARPFLELMHHPLLHEVCFRVYGQGAPVMLLSGEVSDPPLLRAPWRQDASRLADFDRDEVITVVVSLGDVKGRGATVEVVPGSHRLGLLDVSEGGVSPEVAVREDVESRFVSVRIEPGCAVLLHKWSVHRLATAGHRHKSRTAAFVFVDGHVRSRTTGRPHLPMVLGATPRDAPPSEPTLEEARAVVQGELEISGR